MKHIIISLVVICMLISNAFAAGELLEKKEDGKLDLTTVDKTKEKATEITSKDSSISGKITVTDTDISKYKVEKKSSTEISISKVEAKGEHTKAVVCVPKSELSKIDVDKDKVFGILNIDDNGIVTHSIATEAELVAGKVMTFSTNIVNGYSGYKQYTFPDVESGDTLNIEDVSGNYTITAAIDGVVPTYTSGIPTGYEARWDFENISGSNVPDISGNGHTGQLVNSNVIKNTVFGKSYCSNSTGYVVLGANNEFNFSDYTVSLWVNKTNHYTATADVLKRLPAGKYNIYISTVTTTNAMRSTIYDGTYTPNIKSSTALSTGVWESWTVSRNITSKKLYLARNGVPISPVTDTTNVSITGTASTILSGNINLDIDDVVIYPYSFDSSSKVRQIYAGGSGISFQPEPSYNFTGYNVASGVEKVLNTDATTTGIEYVDTTGGTHDVTVTVYFTEDTTLLSETVQDGFYQNGVWHPSLLKVSMEYTPLNNMTSGTITYEYNLPANSTSAYVDDLVSNDSGAIASINSTHLTVHTTTLTAGQTYTYDTYIAFVYDSYTDEPNAMYRTSNKLAEDIDAAFLLAGILFTVCIGVAILGLLAGLATGRIDISAAVTSVGILIISEIFIVIGIVVISYMFGGMI